MSFMNKFFSRYLDPIDGEGSDLGGGGEATPEPTPGEQGGEQSGAGASDGGLGEGGGEPASGASTEDAGSMLDAIEKGLKEIESGGKPGAEAGEPDDKQKADDKAKPDAPEDLTKTPEGLHPKAATRFQKLVETIKERDKELEQVRTSSQQAQTAAAAMGRFVKETGATSDQFSMVGEYLKARNSGDAQTEFNIITGLIQDLQMRTGVNLLEQITASADPLTRFPDLHEAVTSYQITREHALELARAREANDHAQQAQQAQHARLQEARQWISAKDQTINTMREWERSMAVSDPDYAEVSAVMRGNGEAMQWIVKNTPPNQWQHHMTMLYNQTKAARAKWGKVNPTPGERPLSGAGSQPQGTGKAPKTMFNAMFPNG
jgi:hypothetical protein